MTFLIGLNVVIYKPQASTKIRFDYFRLSLVWYLDVDQVHAHLESACRSVLLKLMK